MLWREVKQGKEREWEGGWKASPRGWRWSDRLKAAGEQSVGVGGAGQAEAGVRWGEVRWGFVAGAGEQEGWETGTWPARGVLAGFSGSSGCWSRDLGGGLEEGVTGTGVPEGSEKPWRRDLVD